VRQKFTGKERDGETGLDYFGARHYANTQGRFTSPDPLLSSGTVYDPQTWDRYSYTLNNPLKYTDPFGLYVFSKGVSDEYKKKFRQGLKDLKSARDFFKKGSDEYKRLDKAFNAYGTEGVDNGVTVNFGPTGDGAPAATTPGIKADANGMKIVTADNPTGQDINVTVDPTQTKSADDYVGNIGHEGTHVADISALVGALPNNLADTNALQAVLNGPLNLTKYGREKAAYEVTSIIAQARSIPNGQTILTVGPGKYEVWNSGWSSADRATKRAAGIDKVLAQPKTQGGLYEVTPANQGDKIIP
jgi:RHS repeat-associated protein